MRRIMLLAAIAATVTLAGALADDGRRDSRHHNEHAERGRLQPEQGEPAGRSDRRRHHDEAGEHRSRDGRRHHDDHDGRHEGRHGKRS